MKDKIRDKILVVSLILLIGTCVMTLISNQITGRMQEALNQERYKRITAEENFNKAASKINSLENELAGVRDKIQSVQTILEEGKQTNADLESHLESVTKAKETLENKIDELQSQVAAAPKSTPEQNP